MDVLHFIKTDHDALRAALAELQAAAGVKLRRQHFDELTKLLNIHLTLQKDYLYPEIAGLFPGAQALVDIGLAHASGITKKSKALGKLIAGPAAEQVGFEKKFVELKDAILTQIQAEEASLLPKMRDLIRTEEREDLGDVFQDAHADLMRATASGSTPAAPVAAAPVARKRA